MKSGYILSEIAELLSAQVIGDPTLNITAIASLHNLKPHTISFSRKPGYPTWVSKVKNSAVIVREQDYVDCGIATIIYDNPYRAFAKISKLFKPRPQDSGIAASAIVAASAQISDSAYIGPYCIIAEGCVIGANTYIDAHCVIMQNSVIGKDCLLSPHVTIHPDSVLGTNVRIHASSVIGGDGFGFSETPEHTWEKIEHLGRVVIGDNVEIGAHTTIDRAALDETVIEEGVIIGNQVQIAHNVHIGAHTAITDCSGIAGSSKVGKYCRLAGMTAVIGHVEICDHVILMMGTIVTKSIKRPGAYAGNPAQDNKEYLKHMAIQRTLVKKESKDKAQ